MKKMLLILLIIPKGCFTQNKKDNTILLRANISTQAIKTILFQNNYSVDGSDTTFIRTTSKAVPKTSVSVKLMILKTDTAILLKGMFKSLVTLSLGSAKVEDDYRPIEFKGMKGSDFMDAWNEMQKVAKQLSAGSVAYLKQ